MSSNKGAKARRKAFAMAAWVQSPDEPADVVTRVYEDAWNAIWTRALRYADRVWMKDLQLYESRLTEARELASKAKGDLVLLSLDMAEDAAELTRTKSNLAAALETAQNRLARIQELEKANEIQQGRFHRQALTIQEKVADNNDLRDQVAALMADRVGDEEELARLQGQVKQLTDKRDQLLKVLAEEKTLSNDLGRTNERLVAEVNVLRDRLAAATEPKRSCGATLQEGHTHRCSKYEHHKGGTHACGLCGRTWFAIR